MFNTGRLHERKIQFMLVVYGYFLFVHWELADVREDLRPYLATSPNVQKAGEQLAGATVSQDGNYTTSLLL